MCASIHQDTNTLLTYVVLLMVVNISIKLFETQLHTKKNT